MYLLSGAHMRSVVAQGLFSVKDKPSELSVNICPKSPEREVLSVNNFK